ncbi:SURF1 family protein [Agrilutibacter solisilvae]|uniref:SURF1-like protein n=1 Tax=Agrilutibacter solisilvae TaxID=2763317 RepID=A0A975ATD3_9GAMM|nr:SURF1 family protein [Lysobacter solisilvae]QSX78999.1 SURF1 family protein [Lysobacter solisilvae]
MSRRHTLVVGWVLAALVIAGFASLGRWQLHRALEKQAMLDAAARVLARRDARPLWDAAADARQAHDYTWAEGDGAFVEGQRWLLDNQIRGGVAGLRIYGVFFAHLPPEPTTHPGVPPPPPRSTAVLVDLGWVALPPDRRLDPQRISHLLGRVRRGGPIEVTRHVRGLLAPPPSSGLRMGPPYAELGHYKLMTRVDLMAMAKELGVPLAPRVLRLDPALPLGYERDLALLANTLPPEKHRGYAVQWFALALAVLITATVLTFRKARHERRP